MKKTIPVFLLFVLFSCSENEPFEKDFPESIIDTPIADPEDVQLGIPVQPITENSQKAMLIGDWIDAEDPSLQVTITPTKYITYVEGSKNWNNAWGLSKSIAYTPENIADDGQYILVYLENIGDVFYAQEVVSLSENELEVLIVKSNGGTGMTKIFVRK